MSIRLPYVFYSYRVASDALRTHVEQFHGAPGRLSLPSIGITLTRMPASEAVPFTARLRQVRIVYQ